MKTGFSEEEKRGGVLKHPYYEAQLTHKQQHSTQHT